MTAQLNYFGASFTDVVNAFPDSILSDFGPLEFEFDTAEAEILSCLSPRIIKIFDQVPGVKVKVNPTTLQFHDLTTTLPYLSGGEMHAFKVPSLIKRTYLADPDYFGIYTTADENRNIWLNQETPVTQVNDNTWTLSRYAGGDLFILYDVDTTKINMPSLKSIVANRVQGSVGNVLYSRPTEVWPLVTYYLNAAEKALEKMDELFVLPEFLRLTWYNILQEDNFGSVRVFRG